MASSPQGPRDRDDDDDAAADGHRLEPLASLLVWDELAVTSRWIIGGPDFNRGFRAGWMGPQRDLICTFEMPVGRGIIDPEYQLVIDPEWRASFPEPAALQRWVLEAVVVRFAGESATRRGVELLRAAALLPEGFQLVRLDEGELDIG